MCHPCPASTCTKDKQLHAIALKPSLSPSQSSRPLVCKAQLKKFNQLGYQQSQLLSSADNLSPLPRVQVHKRQTIARNRSQPSLSPSQLSPPLVCRAQLKTFNQLGYQQSKLLSSADNVSSLPVSKRRAATAHVCMRGCSCMHLHEECPCLPCMYTLAMRACACHACPPCNACPRVPCMSMLAMHAHACHACPRLPCMPTLAMHVHACHACPRVPCIPTLAIHSHACHPCPCLPCMPMFAMHVHACHACPRLPCMPMLAMHSHAGHPFPCMPCMLTTPSRARVACNREAANLGSQP
eukprot:364987-Chlamydomonas_euryale.AAC.7